jgi:ADP-ribosyl-[dinitrogen reductase] hydrolase
VLSAEWPPLATLHAHEPLHEDILRIASGSYRDKRAGQIRSGGYVVNSLEAALWSFFDARDFSEAVLTAVNLGNDADTTGAVCGQMAGAYFGAAGIPGEWLDGLARRSLLEDAVRRLCVP